MSNYWLCDQAIDLCNQEMGWIDFDPECVFWSLADLDECCDFLTPLDTGFGSFTIDKVNNLYGWGPEVLIAAALGGDGDDFFDLNATLASLPSWYANAANGTIGFTPVILCAFGGAGNDTITGAANSDTIWGGDGNDVLSGLGGTDFLFGEGGNDRLSGGTGNDFADGGKGDDYVVGDAGNDHLAGGDGSDGMLGGDGDDVMLGDNYAYYGGVSEGICDGNDSMDGGKGNDIMYGQGGADMMQGGDGCDQMDGGSGKDNMVGGNGDDLMFGGADCDVMNGGNGNDLMQGGDANDTLSGAAGDDWLTGGKGNDMLTGGAGDDHFVFCETCGCGGTDTIKDFQSDDYYDQIDLTALENLDNVKVQLGSNVNKANLILWSWGDDGVKGGGDDFELGRIIVNGADAKALFSLDTTYGTGYYDYVRLNEGVQVDLPSGSIVIDGLLV